MSSGQWDLQALEAIEREASEIFDVLDVPERLRRSSPAKQKHCAAAATKKVSSSTSTFGTPSLSAVGDGNCGGRGCGDKDNVEFELQDHIKHCSCSCNHMGYGNYMDYQVYRGGHETQSYCGS